MRKKNEAHLMVMESLPEALLQLMEQKPLADINVSELCQRAGVSRVSFYRNYDSMQDILIQYLKQITDEWWTGFSQKGEQEFYQSFWSELLEQYRQNEKLIKLLYKNNASYVLKEHIFTCCDSSNASDEQDAYARAALAGAIYGLVDEWIGRGMKEFPESFSIHKIASLMPY